MSTAPTRRLPVSTRHAFALAFDLAFRRDPIHSLVVPFLLRAPWILALAILPSPDHGEMPTTTVMLVVTALALIGDGFTALLLGGMLRIRARSVFNTPAGTPPLPARDTYARGLRRVPWLFATEAMRNFTVALALAPTALAGFGPERLRDASRSLPLLGLSLALIVPLVFVLYRLGVATEAVVLDERDLAAAFQASFRHMRRHLERWMELIAAGVVLTLLPALVIAVVWLFLPTVPWNTAVAFLWLVIAALWPIVQYAWTFFYLRLVEVDAAWDAAHPAPAQPRLAETG
jgi:hypothetical protein